MLGILLLFLLALLLLFRSSPPSGRQSIVRSPSQSELQNKPLHKGPAAPAPASVPNRGSQLPQPEARLAGLDSSPLKRNHEEPGVNRIEVVAVDKDSRQLISNINVQVTDRGTRSSLGDWSFSSGKGILSIPAGRWSIKVSHADYESKSLPLDLDENTTQNLRRVVSLAARFLVTGTVVDQLGSSVSGASLQFGNHGEEVGGATSSSDGSFECRLPTGTFPARIRKRRDYAEAVVTSPPRGPLILVLPISPGQIVFSGIVHDQSEQSIADAEIRVWEVDDAGGTKPLGFAYTSSDGRFGMEVVPCARAIVEARARGYEPARETVSLSSGGFKEIELRGYQPFEARLQTPDGKLHERGFVVFGVGPSGPKVIPGRDGKGYAKDCPVEIRADASALGFGASEVALLACSQTAIALRIPNGGGLTVTVSNADGTPASSYLMVLNQASDLTLSYRILDSPTGTFTVQHLVPGSYTLSIRSIRANGFRPTDSRVVVREGEITTFRVVLDK